MTAEGTIMRIQRVLSTLIFIALPAAAWAQTPAPAAAPPASDQATAQPASEATAPGLSMGYVDFGIRGTSITGDTARYNRYRDLGDGLFLQAFRLERDQNGWIVNGAADNVGRLDQRFEGRVTRPGTLKAWVSYNQTPWLLSNTTQTIFRIQTPDELRIDDGLQGNLQKAASAQRPAILASFIANNAGTFDLGASRHTGEFGLEYNFDPNTTLSVDVSRMNRSGNIPIAGTFGFSNAMEVIAPVDHHLTDFTATAEHTQGRVLFRVGYTGSFFRNDYTSITWDNPYMLTDTSSAPSQGRESLPPSNDYQSVNGLVAVTMPRHSRLMGSVAFGVLKDVNANILPQTINTAIATTPLERTSVDGNAHTRAANISFTSSPSRDVSFEVRYRYYDYNNRTPVFTITQTVQYDSSFSTETPPLESERYGGSRNNFDASVTLHLIKDSNLRAGYSRAGANYLDRLFASSAEDSEFVSFDRLTSQWFTVHAKYLHASRRGSGLDLAALPSSEVPGLRTFDIADRDRNLFTLVGSFLPTKSGNVSIDVTAGAGKDNYPNSQFGMFYAKHYLFALGVNATPVDKVTFGVSYNLDNFQSLQGSVNASNAAQQADPTRNWTDTNHDRLHSLLANLELSKLADKVDVKFTYNFNRGRTTYLYGLTPDTTLPAISQLPALLSELNRATFDTTYMLTSKIGVGFTYWFERFRVDDFALDASAIPQINMPSTLLLGYQFLPYTAHTFWGHLIYHW
jgi:MtrB/PioB family decaheme-associated outer membrane protein